MRTYRIDVDGVVAEPCFYSDDLRACADWYVREGIVNAEEVTSIQFHQQIFLHPRVLLTHRAISGSVEALQSLHTAGKTLEYFTVRQNFDPAICAQVHLNTRGWLYQQCFPCPTSVRFFWDAGEKLLASLEAQEEEVYLIDDRAEGLIKAYAKIALNDPEKAQQICQRVTLVAFGYADTDGLSGAAGLRIVPLHDWFAFRQLISRYGVAL